MAGPAAQDGESGRGTWLGVGNEACKFNVVHEDGEGDRARGWLKRRADGPVTPALAKEAAGQGFLGD